MNILSLFDGISCSLQVLKSSHFKVNKYYSSEIDEDAIKVSSWNHPEIIQLGDISSINGTSLDPIDLLIGGSPCQDLSVLKVDRKNLQGSKSGLFWEFLRILKEINPRFFLFENVASMDPSARDQISGEFGVEPIKIDAKLFSAQKRKRLFWTNIKGIQEPQDKKILLKDVIESGYVTSDKSATLTASYDRGCLANFFRPSMHRTLVFKDKESYERCLEWSQGNRANPETLRDLWRKFTFSEFETLMGLPRGYSAACKRNRKRYHVLGNGFHIDVIRHILEPIKDLYI